MKITKGSDVFGGKAPGQANITSGMRSAYRSGGNATSALASGLIKTTEQLIGLEMAEEDAKANELKSQYQIEYNEKVAQLDDLHKQNNFAAADYAERHQGIVDDLYGKYSNAHDWKTKFGDGFNTFLDLDKENKRVGIAPKVSDIAMQNQSISWQRGEQNRSNAAIGGDYQNLQNQINDQLGVYRSAPYLVAYGDRAVANEQKFIDGASAQWMERQVLAGSDPNEMLLNIQSGSLFQNASEEVKTNMVVKLNAEIKRQQAEAEKLQKKQAEMQQIALAAQNIELTGIYNPDDKMQAKAFKMKMDYFQQAAGSPQEALKLQQDYRVRVGYIEPEAVGQLSAALFSRDPQKAHMAVQLTSDYLDKNPSLAKYFSKKKELMYVTNMAAEGVDIATAIDLFKETQTMPADRKKELLKLARDKETLDASTTVVAERVAEAMGGDSTMGFGGWGDENDEKVKERAARLFPEFYTLYQGNAEAAERAVIQQIASSHAVTNVGGKETLMYKAPATYMPQEGKAGQEVPQVKKMFETEMNEAGIPFSVVEGAELAFLREQNGKPVYAVTYQNEPVRVKGKTVTWQFDPAAVQEVAKEEEIEKIKQKRDEAQEAILRRQKTEQMMRDEPGGA